MNRKSKADSQKKDFQYAAKLAENMRRASSPDDSDINVEPASIDELSSIIDIEPGTMGSMNGDTLHTINEIRQRSKRIEHEQADPYDNILGFGESFLDLGDGDDDMMTDGNEPMTPSELINAVDAVTLMLSSDVKDSIAVRTDDGKAVTNVIIKDGTVVLVTK